MTNKDRKWTCARGHDVDPDEVWFVDGEPGHGNHFLTGVIKGDPPPDDLNGPLVVPDRNDFAQSVEDEDDGR